MRLTNHAVGMPFEAFHRNCIQIPFVVNHHMRKAERETVQKRRPETELRYAIKYYDLLDRGSVNRFLGAVEEMIRSGRTADLADSGALPKLKQLLSGDDLKTVFEAQSLIVKTVHGDPNGRFSAGLLSGGGLDLILNMIFVEDRPPGSGEKNGRASRPDHARMIRGNALYILGHLLSKGFVPEIMDTVMVDILLGRSEDEDPVSRGNALFCFRMAARTDPNHFFNMGTVSKRTREMLDDPDPGVREEAVRALLAFLEGDIVQGEHLEGVSGTVERLAGSLDMETLKAAEQVLLILKERGFMEE